jgi:hypothetical protein
LLTFRAANLSLGIGTTTPNHKLDVNGTVSATLYNGNASGTTNAVTFSTNGTTG